MTLFQNIRGYQSCCEPSQLYQRYLELMLKHSDENLSTAHGKSHDIYTPLIALLLDTVVIVLHIQHTPGLLAECSVSLALCCQLTAGHQVGPTKPMARLELVFFSTFEQLNSLPACALASPAVPPVAGWQNGWRGYGKQRSEL